MTPWHVLNVQWAQSATKRAGGMSITVRENHYYHSLFNSLTAFRNPVPTFHNMFIRLYPFSLLLIYLFLPRPSFLCPSFLSFYILSLSHRFMPL